MSPSITTTYPGCIAAENVAMTALIFPGSDVGSDSIIFGWNEGEGTGAPLARQPATFIWRAYPVAMANYHYWSSLFHSHYWGPGAFNATPYNYYGFHPYPDFGNNPAHLWEISAKGDDYTTTTVTYDSWFTQVARATGYFYEFWPDWPSATGKVEVTDSARGEAANPLLCVGDAPWNPGNEIYSGRLRGFQYYDAALSDGDIALELANPGSTRTPWYLNLNPTPSDISDKSGNGNDPTWITATHATLWTG